MKNGLTKIDGLPEKLPLRMLTGAELDVAVEVLKNGMLSLERIAESNNDLKLKLSIIQAEKEIELMKKRVDIVDKELSAEENRLEREHQHSERMALINIIGSLLMNVNGNLSESQLEVLGKLLNTISMQQAEARNSLCGREGASW